VGLSGPNKQWQNKNASPPVFDLELSFIAATLRAHQLQAVGDLEHFHNESWSPQLLSKRNTDIPECCFRLFE